MGGKQLHLRLARRTCRGDGGRGLLVTDGCSNLTHVVVRGINNGDGVISLARYVAHLHFGLRSRDGTGASILGRASNVIAIVRSNKRCVIIVNRRITSICSTIYAINRVAPNNTISSGNGTANDTRTPGRGRDLFGTFIDVIAAIFTPYLNILTTANVMGNFVSLFITVNILDGADNACGVLCSLNSDFFCFVPVLLTCATSGGFNLPRLRNVAVNTTLLCPCLSAASNVSVSGLFKVPIIVPTSNGCASDILPVIYTVTFTT